MAQASAETLEHTGPKGRESQGERGPHLGEWEGDQSGSVERKE